jgi:CarD family transcriptional regulator
VKTSAAKAASTSAKAAAKKGAKSTAPTESKTVAKSARSSSASKNSAARGGPVVEPTTATKPVEKASAKAVAKSAAIGKAAPTKTSTPKTPATKASAPKAAAPKTSAPKATVSKPAEPKAAAKPVATKPAAAKVQAPKSAVESAVEKPAATKIFQQPAPASAQAAPAKAVKAATASVPSAPGAAQEAARGSSSPFPAGASAPSGKSSATPTAGEDKKLAKKSEQPVTTPVVVEKTSVETKDAPKVVTPVKAKPAGPKHGFKLNEFIVYPAHGVGQITGVEIQEVAGFSLELFVVSFIKDKMILKVPTSKVANVGMRKLAEGNVVEKALGTLSGRARIKRTMWSRRAQEYEAKINSGDLVTIAEVVRDLYRSDTQPEQSYSERQLYEAALDRMAREVAAVRKLIDSEALKLIESFLQKGPRRGQKTEADAVEEVEVADEEDVDRAA